MSSMTDNLVERLRSRLESVYDYQTQGPEWREDLLAREAANEIIRLQEALAAAEAEIERLLPIEAEAAEGREINGELRAKLVDARPIIEGLLTAYIEADEDGLTEHAEPIIAARAFLRSLSNDEAPK